MKRTRYAAWILGSVLTCVAFMCAAAPESKSPPPPRTDADIPELPNLNFSLPPLAHFQEIVERPLFMPDRKPQAPEEQGQAAPTGPVNPPQARLLGTIITPDKRQALIEDVLNGKVVRLEQGQPLQDWQVKEIKPDRVLLGRTGQQQPQELMLRVYNEGQPGAAGADLTAQAAAQAGVPQPGSPVMQAPGRLPQVTPPQRRILQRRYDARTRTR